MKKFQIVLALMAVVAISLVASVTASAETTLLAEWLLNGAPITELVSTTTTGKILLTDLVIGLTTVSVECEGSFAGSVGPNGEDEITEVLTAGGVAVQNNLVGAGLKCTVVEAPGACKVGEEAQVWPDGLPWHTELFLMESGAFLDAILANPGSEPGYHVICVVTGTENLCEGKTSSVVSNGVGTLAASFDSTAEEAKCTTGSGMLLSPSAGLIASLTGELTVSSE